MFHKVAREVEGKTVPDVIEFYYMWKKTHHYKQWKAMWRSEQSILQAQDDDTEDDEEDDAEENDSPSSGSSSASADRGERAESRGRKGGDQHGRGSSS